MAERVNSEGWFIALLAVLCLLGLVDWLSVETRRLYVEEAIANRQAGTVWQHFAIGKGEVVPQIVTKDDARFVFPLNLRTPHRLLFELKPKGSASYEIYWISGNARRLLGKGEVSKAARMEISVPRGEGELEFAERGSLAWLDPRLIRGFFLWPLYGVAALALTVLLIRQLRAKQLRAGEWLLFTAVLLITLVVVEAVLRNNRRRLPAVVIAARKDLGHVAQDSRWIDPARYKMRLRPNLDTFAEWTAGDITRMGFIPKGVSRPVRHRYSIRTDAEGFRNARVREKIDIAALGDSFTDGTTSAAEETWPARLEQLTGKAVQNYGTSSFGPQQSRYVFQDFAAAKRARWAVLALFAANDLNDAEAFERWERGEAAAGEEPAGWKLAGSFRRYETFYLWTLLRVAAQAIGGATQGGDEVANQPATAPADQAPRFDQGMFHVPVAGRLLEFAFFPPYLQKLGRPRAEIAKTRGWELTVDALKKLKAECEQNGTTLVLMSIPAKAQVYWPLAERSFSPGTLQQSIDFYCRYNNMPLRLDDVRANLLEQNALVRDFCAAEGIPLLDLTEAMRAEVAAGRETFFPDDTHWNALGHEVAARELAEFLEAIARDGL